MKAVMTHKPNNLLPTDSSPYSGGTRIIWCVEAADIPSVSEKLFHSSVDGICVESFLDQPAETLACLKKYQEKSRSSALPAMMLSLVSKEKFALASLGSSLSVEPATKVVISKDPSSGTLTSAEVALYCEEIPPDNLWQSIASGDHIFIGYDACMIQVLSRKQNQLHGEVIRGGIIAPGMSLHLPLKSELAVEMIETFIEQSLDAVVAAGVHYLLVPGALPQASLEKLRSLLPKDHVASPWLIYRVDSQNAMNRVSDLLPTADGVMIARRELALTAQPDLIPVLTKEIIDQCRDYAKLTIVASQMLGSMQRNITPTRAEVSDIANAVFDGADAIMLSEDILKGKYAFDALQLAEKIIDGITGESSSHKSKVWAKSEPDGEMDVICTQAAKTAMRVGAKALVCITKTGNTAIRLSSLDAQLPIIAITFDKRCCQKLRLLRGVKGMMLLSQPCIDEVLPKVNELLKQSGWLTKHDKVVFVTVTLSSMSQEASNLFTIQSIY